MKRLRKDYIMKIKTLFLSIVVCFMGSARTYADGTFPAITSVPFPKLGTNASGPQYRNPSLVRIDANTLIAFANKRSTDKDVGTKDGHSTIVAKKSTDNGTTWGDQVTILDATKQSDSNFKYGDPATVYDPVSKKILLMCCGGTLGYAANSKLRTYKALVDPATLTLVGPNDLKTQVDGPTDVTDQIYGLFNTVDPNVTSLFPTSGEMCRSKYIKNETNGQFRIYLALTTMGGAKVIYTDDLGKNWTVLRDKRFFNASNVDYMYEAANSLSDETKCVELPDTSVWITSRYNKDIYSRGFNVFNYDRTDPNFTTGTWNDPNKYNCEATPKGTAQARSNFVMTKSRCNGSLVIVPACRVSDGTHVYLALHSIPYGDAKDKGGNTPYSDRTDLGINWKVLKDRNDFTSMNGDDDYTVTANSKTYPVQCSSKLLTEWKNYQLNADYSAYSTMLDNGTDGVDLLFEHTTTAGQYDIAYQRLPISTITGGAYTYAGDLDNAAYMNVNVKPVPGNVYLIKARYYDANGNITESYLHSNFKPITKNGVTDNDNAALSATVASKNFPASKTPDPTYYWIYSKEPQHGSEDMVDVFASLNADGYIGWNKTGGTDYSKNVPSGITICTPFWFEAFEVNYFTHKKEVISGSDKSVTAYPIDGYAMCYNQPDHGDRYFAIGKPSKNPNEQEYSVNYLQNTGNKFKLSSGNWSSDLIFVKVQPSGKSLDNPKVFGTFNTPTYSGQGYPITFARSNDDCDAYKQAVKNGTEAKFDFNYYASLRAPFAVYVPDGVKVYKLNRVDPKNYTLDMQEYTSLPTANGRTIIPRETPVIMQYPGTRGNGETSVTKYFEIAPSQTFDSNYKGDDEKPHPTTNFNGTLGRRVFDDTVYKSVEGGTGSSVYYLLGKVNGYVALYRLGKNSKNEFAIAHNKAYFVFNTQNGTSQAKPFFAMSFGGDETTVIQSVGTKGIADGKVYDLNGRYMGTSLNGLAKGIYILNGRKVVK